MKASLCLLSAAVGLATANYAGNINYYSPSLHHPSLGISIRKVAKRSGLSSPWDPSQLNFTHGIASGDPYDDSIILWTRVAPSNLTGDNDHSNETVSGNVPLYDHSTENYVNASKAPICVQWKVTTDKNLTQMVSSGTAYTSSDIDYTVKVEAKKLSPFSTYYYQFNVCGSSNKSPVGRTKTIPTEDSHVMTPVKIAVYSCSNYPFGFFNAFGNPVRKDSVDYVLHVGDYIYEYKNGDYGWGNSMGRIPQPDREIYTLYDYRRRYATYRTDLDLLLSHQQFPWIAVWDDHEVADNTWRAGSSELNNTEDSFVKDGGVSVDQRKMNAVRAYFEWMPIRQVAMDDNLRIWRTFKLATCSISSCSTRATMTAPSPISTSTPTTCTPSPTRLAYYDGSRQEAWFYNQLRSRRVGAPPGVSSAVRPFSAASTSP